MIFLNISTEFIFINQNNFTYLLSLSVLSSLQLIQAYLDYIRPKNVNKKVANNDCLFLDSSGKASRLDTGLSQLLEKFHCKKVTSTQARALLKDAGDPEMISYSMEETGLTMEQLAETSKNIDSLIRYAIQNVTSFTFNALKYIF